MGVFLTDASISESNLNIGASDSCLLFSIDISKKEIVVKRSIEHFVY